MNTKQLTRIVERSRELMESHYRGPRQEGGCLYWMRAGIIACTIEGVYATPQAGTAAWRRVGPERTSEDNSSFCYEWEGIDSVAVQGALRQSRLPEIHCWIGLPEEQRILDLTAGFQPGQCLETSGLSWDREPMPETIYGDHGYCDSLGAFYKPEMDATFLAMDLLCHAPWGEAIGEPIRKTHCAHFLFNPVLADVFTAT